MGKLAESRVETEKLLFSGITGNVLILGMVSFLTDVSSEMIYPLLPLFLTTVLGAGPAFLGVIEGVAESTASLLKLFSGIASDRVSDRQKLVLFGYTVSACARPLIALAATPAFVLFVRFFDRVGKGIRTSPRDALIADSVDSSLRGKAFGFHRSMDHAGAIVGPLIATLLLTFFIKDIRTIFWLAAIPGLLAVLLIILRVRDVSRKRGENGAFMRMVPRGKLRAYLIILFLFTLGNSSDAFLLLKAGQLGVTPARIPLLWMFFHLVKMFSSMPFGALSDRIGRRSIIVSGWCVYALAYAGFSLAATELHVWLLFAFYGLFYGLTEGVEKALLVDIADPGERGGAFGWYNFAIGAGALPASLIFGIIWQKAGSQAAFAFGAFLAILAAILLAFLINTKENPGKRR
ncbi:major facilitator superfamily MFS_1 [Geotalea uraniireducens Rf4]|uniref:Major facilitator superfamily MFS_1 n=1 Tax=Geotalea uraniireducens (strain Rf4) TaxID=351605 RepID=A5GB53_GEOUR|nr:major facilitator superfamily MFS_1 [Geotalea uraniireducens Rf4]